jgi:hypothetical protein
MRLLQPLWAPAAQVVAPVAEMNSRPANRASISRAIGIPGRRFSVSNSRRLTRSAGSFLCSEEEARRRVSLLR